MPAKPLPIQQGAGFYRLRVAEKSPICDDVNMIFQALCNVNFVITITIDDFRLNGDIYQRIAMPSLAIRKQQWRCQFTGKFPMSVIMNHLFRFFSSPYRIRLSTEVKDYKYENLGYAKSLRWADLSRKNLNEHVYSSKTFPNESVLPL